MKRQKRQIIIMEMIKHENDTAKNENDDIKIKESIKQINIIVFIRKNKSKVDVKNYP